eukprot:5558479-Amphidinium_carterae.1
MLALGLRCVQLCACQLTPCALVILGSQLEVRVRAGALRCEAARDQPFSPAGLQQATFAQNQKP